MTNQHPITPPPELVQQWAHLPADWNTVASLIAQWGADTELEACCEVLARELICDGKHVATDLRMIRRPKPPSLKEQALQELNLTEDLEGAELSRTQVDLIRRALEELPDD
jgi:hypothetical protein